MGSSDGDRMAVDRAAGVQVGDRNVQHNYFYFGEQDTVPLASGERPPYRGLAPFEGADQGIFFGRDDAVEAVMGRLAAGSSGIVVVSGASGVGKSSLLRAGVLPRLSRDGLPGNPGARTWPRLLFTPGATPLMELAVQVAVLAGTSGEEARRSLAANPQFIGGLARQAVLAQARQQAEQAADLGARQRLMLVVDQFEQVFRLCRNEDERRAFIAALESAASAPESSVLVVLVVRSGHERRCAEYPQLAAAIRDRYVVQPMTGRELELAINAPARQAGGLVEPELASRLLWESDSNAGALPWLSDALLRLWNARPRANVLTVAAYDQEGDLIAAAAARSQAVYDALTEDQREIASWLFSRFTPTRLFDTRVLAATWDELHGRMSSVDFLPVLGTLADERVVMLSDVRAEICHRSLLTAWPLPAHSEPLPDDDERLPRVNDPLAPVPGGVPRSIRRLPRVLFAVGRGSDDPAALANAQIPAVIRHLRDGGVPVRARILESATQSSLHEELGTFLPDVLHLIFHDESKPGREPAESLLNALNDVDGRPQLIIVWLCGTRSGRSAIDRADALFHNDYYHFRPTRHIPVIFAVANDFDAWQLRAFTGTVLVSVLRGTPLDEAMKTGQGAAERHHVAGTSGAASSTGLFAPRALIGVPLVDRQLLSAIDERIDALGLAPVAADGLPAQLLGSDRAELVDRLLDANEPLKVAMATGYNGHSESAEWGLLHELAADAVRAGAIPVVVAPSSHDFRRDTEISRLDLLTLLDAAISRVIDETRVRLGLRAGMDRALRDFFKGGTELTGPPRVARDIRDDMLQLVADLPPNDPVWARAPGELRVMLLCHCGGDLEGPVGSVLDMLGPAGLVGDGEAIPVVLVGANTADLMDALPRFVDKPWSVVLPLGTGLDADAGTGGEADEIRALAAAGDYRQAGERLARLAGADPQADDALRLELGFITLPDPDRQLVATAWSATAAGHTVESLLAGNDDVAGQPGSADGAEATAPPTAGDGDGDAAEAALLAAPAADTRPRRSPQQSGAVLEQATVDLFARFFAVDEDAIVSRLRRQGPGAQFGHDIELECTVAGSPAVRVHVECKNLGRAVTVHDIAGKLAQQRHYNAGAQIDHWILISPHHDGANDLPGMLDAWTNEYPFSVQVWSPETRVRELFALEPVVYEAVYGQPPTLAEAAGLAEAAALVKQRLAPRLRVDAVWRRYLAEPSAFCFVNEKQRHFDGLYTRHLPLRAADAAGALLGTTLMDHVIDWAKNDGSAPMLLLADFGEGKSVFTYCLARRLAEEFVAAPDGALFPLRIPLREFHEAGSARGLIERRLHEIGATFADWRALTRQVPTLAILDGFDEMSAKLTRAAISANLREIESCIRELPDSKILVTSRQRVLDGSRDWWRTLDRLGQPQVMRIAPAGRPQRVRYLEQFATDEAAAQVLANLRSLYDPIGLAAKPLFLEMIKDTLRELPGHTFSETILYDTYINKSLRHKYELLADPDEELTKDELIENLKYILEDVAVRLQEANGAYLYLRDYRGPAQGKIAELLWKMRDQDVPRDAFSLADQDDAANRVGIRSLLKAVPAADPERWPVDFFHRSMREYFVAKAIAHALATDRERARKLLSAAPLLPEIAHFAATILRSEPNGAALATLEELIRSATVDAGGYLGGNAFTLLHGAGGQLAERDWSGLCLDHARLHGADLHGARLAGSTLRHANLDNANLEDADLTGANLEGVRLEETSQVLAVTAVDGMRIIAAYEDRTLREWRGRPGADWESRLLATLDHQVERLQVTPLGRVMAAGEGMFSVLELVADGDSPADAGGSGEAATVRCAFATSSRSRLAVLGTQTSLFAEERDGGQLEVTLLDMVTRRPGNELVDDETFTAWVQLDGAMYALAVSGCLYLRWPATQPDLGVTLLSPGITCLAVRADGDRVLLAAGHQDGSVSLRHLGPAGTDIEDPPRSRQLHGGPVTSIFLDAEERLITGSSDRSVCVVPVSAIQAAASAAVDEPATDEMGTAGVQRLHLTLRCKGVRFDGVRTEREQEKLRRYAESGSP